MLRLSVVFSIFESMRLLLFIPILVLFLSNVPFIQRIPLEKAIATMEKNGTCEKNQKRCKNNEYTNNTCTREKSGCDKHLTDQGKATGISKDECCQKTEATCVCICCFQFAASVQAIAEFRFNFVVHSPIIPLFEVGHAKDQYIGAPWQPPDIV